MGNKLILDTILARLDALETSALGRPRKRLSKAELAKAEGVTTRTVDRRIEQRILPPSDDVINGPALLLVGQFGAPSPQAHPGRHAGGQGGAQSAFA